MLWQVKETRRWSQEKKNPLQLFELQRENWLRG